MMQLFISDGDLFLEEEYTDDILQEIRNTECIRPSLFNYFLLLNVSWY